MPTSSDRRRAERRATRRSTTPSASTEADRTIAATAKEPDAEELRRIRAAYFGRPVAERRKVVRPVAAGTGTAKASSTAGSTPNSSGYTTRRKHKGRSTNDAPGSQSKKGSKRESKRSVQDDVDYVYSPTRDVGAQAIASGLVQDEVERDKRRSRHSTRRSSRSSSDGGSGSRMEVEVTPDDSISQVSERRSSRESTRPDLPRSRTTSTKLASVQEDKDEEGNGSQAPPQKSKRNSTLLASMFRRKSASAVPTQPKLVDCLTCGSDDIQSTKSAKLGCGHRMCHECLKRLFNMSVTDPAHMPPKCCTEEHIPLKHVDTLFSDKFKVAWNRKYQEYNTKNRIYCPSPKCGEWIKPSHIHTSLGRKYALCPRCKTKVCVLCNNKMHKSQDCPKDPEIQKLVQQAKDEGWQRCYSCSALVELEEGCNHMTCRCTAEFCMICGSKWKSCDCPWFNYSQLPNPDRLNDMRVPEPVQVLYRRVFAAAGPGPGEAAPRNVQLQPPPRPTQEHTYQQEMDARRQQERRDEDLARRMQFANLMDDGVEGPQRPADLANRETWGLGNQAGHFLNDDFVQNAANVVMSAFGDANMGRRGERASGRRRRAQPGGQNAGDVGLVPNFLGDESVLGVGSPRRPPGR